MKNYMQFSLVLFFVFILAGCAAEGGLDMNKAMEVGGGVLQATMLSEDSVKQTASLAASEMDKKTQVAGVEDPYSQRLNRLAQGLQNYDGLTLNFKVYLASDVNAFAMADGTVRVYSGLMDKMPDDQVLAVICHELGHVKLKHSYQQMREQILSDTAFKAAASVGGYIGSLTSSQLGQIGKQAIEAHFSQTDELEADTYAVKALHRINKDPYTMKAAIQTLESLYGEGGGFLSSHPSNPKRIKNIDAAIAKL
ncbi:M48 family metallopeptidase [Malonomonas rubra]|uniref:M48 family metallopeptidase n=1 Tax=Malonomonas rubra TaxID=57040 RepID=UPI0026F20CD6|nr:M48 family metallopeptidase [Malonomonas rubra]